MNSVIGVADIDETISRGAKIQLGKFCKMFNVSEAALTGVAVGLSWENLTLSGPHQLAKNICIAFPALSFSKVEKILGSITKDKFKSLVDDLLDSPNVDLPLAIVRVMAVESLRESILTRVNKLVRDKIKVSHKPIVAIESLFRERATAGSRSMNKGKVDTTQVDGEVDRIMMAFDGLMVCPINELIARLETAPISQWHVYDVNFYKNTLAIVDEGDFRIMDWMEKHREEMPAVNLLGV